MTHGKAYGVDRAELARMRVQGHQRAKARSTPASLERKARRLLSRKPHCTARSLARDLSVPLATARAVIARLKAAGGLVRLATDTWERPTPNARARQVATYEYQSSEAT